MPEISMDEVKHVARLAHLALSEEELARVGKELNRILEYFRTLAEIDTTDVPITSHAIPMLNVYREDKARPSLPVEQVVANAPDGVDEFFRVPRIVED
ncbi:Asp-tRNA(Asn)/Glu-tRNA(Gln) amidotransferase subunit GatC [bacterium]|nr:Asp-tRNA(Asn)/Glu-tRNA(Gln) amidotransferase subunit GatC [bacterium]